MRIAEEHVKEIVATLREWGYEISDDDQDDLIGEFDRIEDKPDENKIGGFRKGGPSTSKAAAIQIYPRTGSQRYRILMAIRQAGDHGLTAHETAEATGILYRSVTPRIGELKNGGWVRANGKTRRSDMNMQVEVLVLTPKAIQWIEEKEGIGYA